MRFKPAQSYIYNNRGGSFAVHSILGFVVQLNMYGHQIQKLKFFSCSLD